MEPNAYVVDFNSFFIYNTLKIPVSQNKKIVCHSFLHFLPKFHFFTRYMEEKLTYFFMFLGAGLDKKILK